MVRRGFTVLYTRVKFEKNLSQAISPSKCAAGWGRYKKILMRNALVDELDDVLRGGSGEENFGDAGFF